MNFQKLKIIGAHLATHKVFPDDRGIFREWFKSEEILTIDKNFSVQQANYSRSKKWVIRGIHYSLAPNGQAKVVTCSGGSILDVLIDLRIGSPTYMQVEYINLSEDSGKVLYIPSGVGHGFLVTSESAGVVYLTSSSYAPEHEKSICPTDLELGITWPVPLSEVAIISKADRESQKLSSAYQSGLLPRYFQSSVVKQ